MRKQYLHLSIYSCDDCNGPVVAGSVAVRENEISKETEIRPLGAICISCGHRQSKPTGDARVRNLLPTEWDPVKANRSGHTRAAYLEAINRAELH